MSVKGGLDIIGDVHGCATLLEGRLMSMGYERQRSHGAYRHPYRRAIFVGDLIDRGKEQLATLNLVKGMVDHGSARIVMGNHDFNAVAWATSFPNGRRKYLRKHSAKNRRQHVKFLKLGEADREYFLSWFKQMPLWIEEDGIRVVHACWYDPAIKTVRDACGGDRFTDVEQLVMASVEESELHKAVEVLLKGPEISLDPYGLGRFRDKDGNNRDKARIKWWNEKATVLSELVDLTGYTTEEGKPYPPVPNVPLKTEAMEYIYSSTKPVFYGHYWRVDKPEHLDDYTEHTACVDFSAIEKPEKGGGTLVAYRWDGSSKIDQSLYVPHGAGQPSS